MTQWRVAGSDELGWVATNGAYSVEKYVKKYRTEGGRIWYEWATEPYKTKAGAYRAVANKERADHWQAVWQRALANMPGDITRPGGMGFHRGAQQKLARLLGYYGHNGVYNGWRDGLKPKGKRRKRLEVLAGPYGKIFAMSWLKRAKPMPDEIKSRQRAKDSRERWDRV